MSLEIGQGFEKIYGRAFYGFGYSTDISAAPGKRTMSEAEEKTLNIPEGIVSVGEEAFSQCRNIDILSLPSTLENTGVHSFYLSGIPTKVLINRKTPPVMLPGENLSLTQCVFNPQMLTESKLVFPVGITPSDYFMNPNWNFSHYEESDFAGVNSIRIGKDDFTVEGMNVHTKDGSILELYDMNGRLIDSGCAVRPSTHGIYILKVQGSDFKIAL